MIQELLDQILADTFTLAQAMKRLQVLKDLVLVKLFSGKEELPIHITTQTQPGQQTPWITTLDSGIYKHFNRKNVYKIFQDLEIEIKKIKPLIIYLPFDVDDVNIDEIGRNARHLFGKNFLIDIKIDPSLIAGTALVWNGVYKDYSIKQKIAEDRQRILTMLKDFIKH